MTTFNLSEAPNHPRDCLKQKAKHLSVKYHYLLLIMLLEKKKKKKKKNVHGLLNHCKLSYGIDEKDEELRKLIERDHGMRQCFIFKRI